ncbi:MAG: response regulator transcription factor [Anaerobutyricum sp.]
MMPFTMMPCFPEKDGFEVPKDVRNKRYHRDPSVMFLAARERSDHSDVVTGLDYGADDYVVKPFSFDEVLARLRVITEALSSKTQYFLFLSGDPSRY